MKMKNCVPIVAAVAAVVGIGISGAAVAQIRVGITVSASGPGAALGQPQMQTVKALPKEIDGQKVTYVALDDESDPTKAAQNARKLIAEDKIDVLIGSSLTPTSMPLLDIASRNENAAADAGGRGRTGHPDGREAPLGVQGRAERRPAGGRDPQVHREDGREEARLHRRVRRLRRGLLQGAEPDDAEAGHHADHPRGLRARRLERHRTGAEDHRNEPRCGVHRLGRNAGGTAAESAARARLQGPDLPDARGLHRAVHQARRQGRRRHDLLRRGVYRRERPARIQPVPQGRRSNSPRPTRRCTTGRRRTYSARTSGTRWSWSNTPSPARSSTASREPPRSALRCAINSSRARTSI